MSASLFTGDAHDDDGAVFDDKLLPNPDPDRGVIETIPVEVVKPEVPESRIFTGYQNVDPLWAAATLLVPPDQNRKHLMIAVHSTVLTDGIIIGSDPGSLQVPFGGSANAGRVYPPMNVVTIDDHTGPLYVATVKSIGGVASAVVGVSWWTITK